MLTIIFAFAVYVVIYCKPEMMSGMIQVTLPDSERDRLLNMAFADQTWFFRKFIPQFFENYAVFFTTYYMNIAIAMAGALLFPDAEVLFMMFIPMKLKILGLIDLLFMLYYFFRGDIITKFAVAAALLNFFFFYTSYRKFSHPKPAQIRRRAMYQHKVQQAQALTKHKCAICGRTEETDPNMEFRYCSKCEGNYEYC
ncbi:MAG: hypothetical protein J6Z35_02385 [Lachnospiraceae bacterium]|nr:hypothetical protein [Lachnospiraceae bacterium]